MTYNLHEIFLVITIIINLITIISSGFLGLKNINTDLKKEVVYSSISICVLSFIIMCLLITYMTTKKLIFFKFLIASYVFLTLNIGLFIFFSFYKDNITKKLSENQEFIFSAIIISFGISLLFFLLSDQYILKKIDKGLKDTDIEMKNYKSKIVEYNEMYSPERNDYIYVEKSFLKDNNKEYYNIISLPTKIDNCKVKILSNNCYFKDSDLFTKDGNFSTKKIKGIDINMKYKNKTLKDILDKFFIDIIYEVQNGNTVAFPQGVWEFEKCPLITKYVNKYKNYLLLLAETYDDNLSNYFNSSVLLTPEAIHKINPNLSSIREERIEERRKKFISMAAKSKGMDECDFITSAIGKRKGKENDDVFKFMMTLVKDLDCHDEKKIELAKNLSSNFNSSVEAGMKVNELRNIYNTKLTRESMF